MPNESIDSAMEQSLLEIIVPIGLSFVVFSGISYIVDVYHGESCGTPLEFFVYMSFFPKLISGPIVQWKDFKPQLNNRALTAEQISAGIDLIVIGLAKKVILADVFGAQIALINEEAVTTGIDSQTVWLRSLLFFLQLYYDFSGYSDIAIGLGRIFGFNIGANFNYPYASRSVSEFWRRWHISLGHWFREYVYFPLGGSRRGNVYANLFIVFLLTGIWHGDDWTYVLWGVMNGIAVMLERYIRGFEWYKRIPAPIKWIATINFVFMAWIMFMSADLNEAFATYRLLFTFPPVVVNFSWRYFLTKRILTLIIIGAAGALGVGKKLQMLCKGLPERTLLLVIKKFLITVLLVVDLLFIVNSSYSPFLYFQF